MASLERLTEIEIEKNPSLLSKERRIATALIEGAAERSEIYRAVESDIDTLFSDLIGNAETVLRRIRNNDVGVEKALQEEVNGRKSDEDYAHEAVERRRAKKAVREEEEKRQRQKDAEERERCETEARRRREEEKLREHEQKEREQAKKAEREKQRKIEVEREHARRRRYQQELDQEREERRKFKIRDKDLIENDVRRMSRRNGEQGLSKINQAKVKEKEKDLDEVALELLLKEGQELAAKSKQRPDTERSESLEPPIRKISFTKNEARESAPRRADGLGRNERSYIENTRHDAPQRSSMREKSILKDSEFSSDDDRSNRRHSTRYRREASPGTPLADPGDQVMREKRSDVKSVCSVVDTNASYEDWHQSHKNMTTNDSRSLNWRKRSSTPPSRTYQNRSLSPRKRMRTRSRSPHLSRRYKHELIEGSRSINSRRDFVRRYSSPNRWNNQEECCRPSERDNYECKSKGYSTTYKTQETSRRDTRQRSEDKSQHYNSDDGYVRSQDNFRDTHGESERECEKNRSRTELGLEGERDRHKELGTDKGRHREWNRDRNRADRDQERERDRERDRDRDGDRDRDKYHERYRDQERDRYQSRDRENDSYKERERDRYRERERDKEKHKDRDRYRYDNFVSAGYRDRDKGRDKYRYEDRSR